MPFQQGMPLNANGEVVIGVLPAGSYFRFMAKRIGGNSASLHSDTITTDHAWQCNTKSHLLTCVWYLSIDKLPY